MCLTRKVALVTGASRGIGRAIALEMGKKGALIYGTATTPEGADKISAFLAESGIEGKGLVLNLEQPEAGNHLLSTIADLGDIPTILINNAAINRDNILLRMKQEDWDAVIDTNLSAVYRLTKAFIKPMIKLREGRIINITSIVGVIGNSGQANYAAAKAGLIGFTKALALELASRHITVNAVAPGFIDTDMTKALPEAHKVELLSKIPLERLGLPDEVAAVVGFLASPEAGYITGQTIHVNGGMYMN